MYTYYCIKVFLSDGTVGYYSGMSNGGIDVVADVNSSRFYDTGDQALESYRKVFDGRTWWFEDGVKTTRATIVSVASRYEL